MSAHGTSSILAATTPEDWLALACVEWRDLLIDHANCEKKAASTALAFLFTYPEDALMARQLSRLAREELRHFEQVETLMQSLGVARRRMTPSRYASGLRRHVACNEPERQLDLLAIGALIEARSCERFERLAPRLSGPMAELYRGLCESEARHGQLYLDLARRHAGAQGLDFEARIARFSQLEAQLITRPDPEFRFHSGLPEALGR